MKKGMTHAQAMEWAISKGLVARYAKPATPARPPLNKKKQARDAAEKKLFARFIVSPVAQHSERHT